MAADRRKESKKKNQPRKDPNPRTHKLHRYPELSVQQWAIIIALFSNALFVDSVIINRNKTVQVILGGDFSKMGMVSPEALTDESLAIFEAVEAADAANLSQQHHHHPPTRSNPGGKKSGAKTKSKH
ncbi:hypothetical protein BVG16_03330 [Paenibacillus selenitireducens]|uniref:Uncharacterized protein n=1 Tax=Paenibacillus selenitireducens TaxID=1324314 RepID=A0A1T2XNC2_9BACL|nr:hypothetical protein [Paenibacillus selenitireducens]OPA81357.1 hypothetical protein BVG16_03330 [Paenibacillus selenitireducens]